MAFCCASCWSIIACVWACAPRPMGTPPFESLATETQSHREEKRLWNHRCTLMNTDERRKEELDRDNATGADSSRFSSSAFIRVYLCASVVSFALCFLRATVSLRLNRFTEFGGKNMATDRASNPGGLSAGRRRARWAEGEMPGRRPGRARRRRCVRRHEEPGSFANGAAVCRRRDRAANRFPP